MTLGRNIAQRQKDIRPGKACSYCCGVEARDVPQPLDKPHDRFLSSSVDIPAVVNKLSKTPLP